MGKNHFTIQFKVLAGIIFSLLLAYVITRAHALSLTHDESLSYSIMNGDQMLMGTANNHLLNTKLMSICKAVFGISELSLRLPNVLAFIIYFSGCFLIFRRAKKIWLALFGFALLLLNPFLIEFFSLARGYGLSLGFMVLSMHFMIRNTGKDQTFRMLLADFILASLFASLAIYASLILVNFFIGVLAVFVLKYWMLRKAQRVGPRFNRTFWSVFVLYCIPLILAVSSLLKLKETNQLYFGASSLTQGIDSLLHQSLYLKEHALLAILVVKILIAVSLLISVLFIILKKKYSGALFLLTLLIGLLALGLFAEAILFDAKYPIARTALFYVPLLALLVYQLFVEITKEFAIKTIFYAPVSLALTAMLFVNFMSKANLTHTTSWQFDTHTKSIMKVINDYSKDREENLTISNHWLLSPSINYYIDLWEVKLNKTYREGVNSTSDFIYRLEERDEVQGYSVLFTFDEINGDILIKSELKRK